MVDKIYSNDIINRAAAAMNSLVSTSGSNVTDNDVNVLLNEVSLIQASAEETTFFASERLEKRIKEHKFKSPDPLKKIMAHKISELLERFPDHSRQAQELARKLLLDVAGSSQQLLSKLEELAPTPELRFLTLLILLKSQKDRAEMSAAMQLAQQAYEKELKKLWNKSKKRLVASFNISGAVADSLESTDLSAEVLRSSYQETILDYGGVGETYKKLVDQFGYDRMQEGLEFLLSAMGDDLRSMNRSVSRNRLVNLISDLSKIKAILLARTQSLRAFKSMGLEMPSQKEIGFYMDGLMDLVTNSAGVSSRLSQVMATFGFNDVAERIHFIQLFRQIIAKLPTKVFIDIAARNKLLDHIQSMIDAAVDEEEFGL